MTAPIAGAAVVRDVYRDGGVTVTRCSDGSPCLHLTIHVSAVEAPDHGIRALGRTMGVEEAVALRDDLDAAVGTLRPKEGGSGVSESPALHYGDQGMILRTLIANQRRLIAVCRCLGSAMHGDPGGGGALISTDIDKADAHLDAAIGQLDKIEATLAARAEAEGSER